MGKKQYNIPTIYKTLHRKLVLP